MIFIFHTEPSKGPLKSMLKTEPSKGALKSMLKTSTTNAHKIICRKFSEQIFLRMLVAVLMAGLCTDNHRSKFQMDRVDENGSLFTCCQGYISVWI